MGGVSGPGYGDLQKVRVQVLRLSAVGLRVLGFRVRVLGFPVLGYWGIGGV